MHTSISRKCAYELVIAAACASGCAAAYAATPSAAAEGPALEEVMVTATKIGAARVMDTPISIQALTSQTLERNGITEFSDFAKLVPGLSFQEENPGNKRYVLRGITSGGSPTVGVYLDDINLSAEPVQGGANGSGLQADPQIIDLERIEVLEGPQGTTFGSSALAGVIRYVTHKPEFDSFTLSARAAVTDQTLANGVGEGYDLTMNVPVSDFLAFRGSGYYQFRPGYIDDRYESGVNKSTIEGGRIQARAKLGERATLDVLYQKHLSSSGQGYYNQFDLSGLHPEPQYFQNQPERIGFDDNLALMNATLNYALDFGTVTATVSRMDRHIDQRRPASGTIVISERTLQHNPTLSPEDPTVRSVLVSPHHDVTDSYELRFASRWSAPVQLLAGLYYEDDDRDSRSQVHVVDDRGYPVPDSTTAFAPILLDRLLAVNQKEKALFTEATWSITDKASLVAGLRVFKFDYRSQPTPLNAVATGGTVTGLPGILARASDSSAIGRVIGSYKLAKDTMVYAQVAQGYRPGGSNDPTLAIQRGVVVPDGFTPDKLINYELGLKYSSPDRRFLATLAAFRINWTNIQSNLLTVNPTTGNSATYTGNAGKARVNGVEETLQFQPFAGLTFGLLGAYTDARLQQTIKGAGVAGERLPYTPEVSATATVDYNFPIGNSLTAFLGADVSWQGERTNLFPSLGPTSLLLRAYSTTDIRAGVELERCKIELIGRNMFNDATVVDRFLNSTNAALGGYIRNPPRMLSLEVRYDFK
jgi:outer membrane receptor protein involved in Fe transport